MVIAKSKPMRLNLALQGGGAHGAFTWGALDRLLAEPSLQIGWISATSAGAVNAAALASGLVITGASGARMTLRRVWEAVLKAGVPDLVRLNPFLSGLSKAAALTNVGALMSPYDFNPLGLDPLRDLLAEHIDFAAIRDHAGPELLIAATEVATGRVKLFRRAELRIEHVLASACLPTLHRTVEIDGRAYWDGGFSANPDLVTLATESPVTDTLIIELNPRVDPNVPRSASEIAARVAAITFNQPFLRDIEMIVAAQEADMGLFPRRRHGRVAKLRRHRFHLIEAGHYTMTLGQDSKVQPERKLVEFLYDAGRREADAWLERNRAAVGRRSSVDLKMFVGRGEAQAVTESAEPAVTEPGSVAPFRRRPGGRSRD